MTKIPRMLSLQARVQRVAVGCCLVFLIVSGGCTRQGKESRHQQRAEAYFQAGDYDRAEIEYLNALRLNRTNLVAIRQLGQIALDQGRLSRAYGLFTEIAKQWPDDFQTRLRLAALRLPAGRTPELHAEVEKLVAAQPTHAEALALWVDSIPATNDLRELQRRLVAYEGASGRTPGYHVALGTLLLRQQDLESARQAFQRALELDPKYGKARLGLGVLLQLRQDPAGALREFKAAAELAGPRSTDGLRYADFLYTTGDATTARAWLESTTARAPDFIPAQIRLAQIALAERRYDECERLLKLSLARDAAYLDAMLLMSRLRQAQNDPAGMVSELENAVKAFPRLAQVHQQLALAHLANGDMAAAIKQLNQALAIDPTYVEATRMLAELSLRRGDAPAAAELLRELVRRRPDDEPAQLLLAAAYQGQGDLAAALAVYEQLGRRQPSNAQPAVLQGVVLNRLGRARDARTSFERALVLDPGQLAAAEQLLFMDVAAGQFAAAQDRAQRQVDRAPNTAAPRVLLAKSHLAQTNLPAAEQVLLEAIQREPASREANWLLARLYVAENKHPAALEKLNALAAQNTNDVAAWLQIADVQTAATNYPAAVRAYETVLAINPKSAPALNNLAWLLAEHLGEVGRATELASQARAESPDNPALADTAGWVAFRNGDYARALGLIKEAAKQLGQHPEVLFHLGMTHYMMGEEVPARVALENATQLAPDAPWRTEAAEKILVLTLAPTGDPAAAITRLQGLARNSPKDPLLHLRLAAALQRAGDWQQAMTTYQQALALNGKLVSALTELAHLYHYQAGDSTRALELIRRARELDQSDPVITHLLGKLLHDTAKTAPEFQLALGLLQTAAAARMGDAETSFDYGRAAYSAGQLSNAVVSWRRAAAAQPPSSWTRSSTEYLEIEALRAQPVAAAAAAERVRKLADAQPTTLPAMLVWGVIREQAGDRSGARTVYEDVLRRFPLCALADQALAAVLAEPPFDDVAKAYEHASKAREAYPGDRSVARLLGRLAFRRGDYPRAVQLLQESAPAFPADADLYFDLGFASQKLKQVSAARDALNRALSIAPTSSRSAAANQALSELK